MQMMSLLAAEHVAQQSRTKMNDIVVGKHIDAFMQVQTNCIVFSSSYWSFPKKIYVLCLSSTHTSSPTFVHQSASKGEETGSQIGKVVVLGTECN